MAEVTQGRAPLLKSGHPSLELVNFDHKRWRRRFSSQTLQPVLSRGDECRVYFLGDLCITFATGDFRQL